jgi:cytidylate kinase
MANKITQIAIDGPVGSGKGTLAMELAKRLNAVHIYTGGMYRALALACQRASVNIYAEDEVYRVLQSITIDLKVNEDTFETVVILNGEDITDEIFLPEVSNATPIVAAFESVRAEMVSRQQALVVGKNCVIEGRDIASMVAPDADLKIYLTASVDERANRRYKQLQAKNADVTFDEVKRDVIGRDERDSKRNYSPLAATRDSIVIDTTHDTIEDTVGKVMEELNKQEIL